MKFFKKNRKTQEIWYCDHICENGNVERIYDTMQIDAIEKAAIRKGLTECWWIDKDGKKFDSFNYNKAS